jgi:hypothetical protein
MMEDPMEDPIEDPQTRPGVLMVAMEPPASLEEEFNDWYDTEHFPQRRALPGFLGASRWVCVDGWPRWLAIYELASLAALESDAYRAVSGANSTPWSRRVLPRTVGRTRVAAVSLDAGSEVERRATLAASRLLLAGAHLSGGLSQARDAAAQMRATLESREDLLNVRWFVESDSTLWTLATFDAKVSADALAWDVGRPAGLGMATFNLYAPYVRSAY